MPENMTHPYIREAQRTGGTSLTQLDTEFCNDPRCPGYKTEISACTECFNMVHNECREVCERCGEAIGCINCMTVYEEGFVCRECE
jgi:hypothetical protein